jgi:hypothetical protein
VRLNASVFKMEGGLSADQEKLVEKNYLKRMVASVIWRRASLFQTKFFEFLRPLCRCLATLMSETGSN